MVKEFHQSRIFHEREEKETQRVLWTLEVDCFPLSPSSTIFQEYSLLYQIRIKQILFILKLLLGFDDSAA